MSSASTSETSSAAHRPKSSALRHRILETVSPVAGFLGSLVVLLVIVVLVGESPAKALDAIYRFCFGSAGRRASLFSVMIPLYLSGLAVAFALRGGVFNIGVEGQYFIGGLVGSLAGIYLDLPQPLHIPVVVLAAMAGGALWAALPAVLKITRGIHEVITTIMLNNIAYALANYLVNGPLSALKGSKSLEPQTLPIRPTARFPKLNNLFNAVGLGIPDYVYLDLSLVVAVVMGVVAWIVLFRLRYGFEVRSIGAAIEVSRYAGVRVKRIQLFTFLGSGAIAGLVGLQEIFAIRGIYTFQIATGLGFDGIPIALIGQNSPLGVGISALLFAFLKQAGYGLQLYTAVANAVIYVITGLMIIMIVVVNELTGRYVRALRKKEAA
jgi:simple sugar transport system permease protein